MRLTMMLKVQLDVNPQSDGFVVLRSLRDFQQGQQDDVFNHLVAFDKDTFDIIEVKSELITERPG